MNQSIRINYIDNIKIAITFLVVAHHAGQAYGNTGGVWQLEDTPKLEWHKGATWAQERQHRWRASCWRSQIW